jgi:hypothetical protein
LTTTIAQQTSFMRLLLMIMLLLMIENMKSALAQSPTPSSTTQPTSPEKLLTAILAREPIGEPVDCFTTETPNIYLRWQSQAMRAGAKIRCIWIAENVGSAAPANYHVDEATTTANESQTSGIFTLSKPKTGWPEGKYRVEIYVGTQLVETLPFTIEKPRGD